MLKIKTIPRRKCTNQEPIILNYKRYLLKENNDLVNLLFSKLPIRNVNFNYMIFE